MGGGSLKDMNGGPYSAGSKVSDFNTSGSWSHRQASENEEAHSPPLLNRGFATVV
ncbi:putative potassium voltage-gated channel subfamily H member [Sesbania bispinosa]|nr:putative potassium voltage-gated channel subfamily H member [Sesbania bispinosa]